MHEDSESSQDANAGPRVTQFVDQRMQRACEVTLAGGKAVVICRRGPGKEGPNEDSVLVLEISEQSGLLAVADGVGGHQGGEVASAMLVEELGTIRTSPDNGRDDLRVEILDALEDADRRIQGLRMGAATTVALVEVSGGRIRTYHVGDSTILVIGQGGRVKYRTTAHSPVGYALESGMLSEQEALNHDELHLVNNLVGCEEMRVEVGSLIEIGPRDTILIGSDGLFDNLREDEIVAGLKGRTLAKRAEHLANLASERMATVSEGQPSKPDDLSIALFRLSPRKRRTGRRASSKDQSTESDEAGAAENETETAEPTGTG